MRCAVTYFVSPQTQFSRPLQQEIGCLGPRRCYYQRFASSDASNLLQLECLLFVTHMFGAPGPVFLAKTEEKAETQKRWENREE